MSTGTLVWIGIVLFAVIARMAKTGGQVRQRGGHPTRPAPPQQMPPRPLPPQAVPVQPMTVRTVRRQPPAPAPPAELPSAAMPLSPPMPDLLTEATPAATRRSAGRMSAGFAGRGNMIRAIVAAEVIGPPKAFVELDNWSHRHREV